MTPTSGDVYVSRDFAGNAGVNVSSNQFAADMNIVFTPGVTALGVDLLQWFGNNGPWTVEAFDAGNVSLGSFSTPATELRGHHLGHADRAPLPRQAKQRRGD
jgi:hypothetical protein